MSFGSHLTFGGAIASALLSLASPITHHLSAAPAAGGAGTAGPNPAAAARCDDGRWAGPDGVSVEGRPDGFGAGEEGATYIWHDAEGWHLRTTDQTGGAHHYSGTIALSAGASFTEYRLIGAEPDDRLSVDGRGVLHYDLVTYRGLDGFDFRVSACDRDRRHEALGFRVLYDGRPVAIRVDLGDRVQHPRSADFRVRRTA